jgi:outer membrane protein
MPFLRRPSAIHPALAAGVVIGAMLPAACSRPFSRDRSEDPLARIAAESLLRQGLDERSLPSPPRTLESGPTRVEQALAERREELDAIGPQFAAGGPDLAIGPNLRGEATEQSPLSLREAIESAVANNLGVQVARIDEAISSAEVVRAEAIFDAVLFAGTGFGVIDEPGQQVSVPGGVVVSPGGSDARTFQFETGLSQFLPSGGTVEVSTGTQRFDNRQTAVTFTPNPEWDANLELSIAQPLLRGFGSDVNTARIALARNEDRREVQRLRQRLLDVVAETEAAYWSVVRSRQELAIARWLVEVGEQVRDVLERRRQLDVTLADFADAVATVESRKAGVIRAERRVANAVDRLKRIVNSPQFPLGEERSILPTDWMTDAPFRFSVPETFATAVSEAPPVQLAILSIDDASIREIVADNGRLPQLDLAAQMAWFGQSSGFGDSYERLGDAQFIEYVVGLQFSQPIGNRAAEAAFRQARLRRSAAVLGYRTALQDTILAVRIALQDVVAGWQLISQTRSFRIAQAENLRALLVLERTRASLTPEFLNLKFQRQNGLALAQLEEVNALVEYNVAIANLHRAMGVGLAMNRITLQPLSP